MSGSQHLVQERLHDGMCAEYGVDLVGSGGVQDALARALDLTSEGRFLECTPYHHEQRLGLFGKTQAVIGPVPERLDQRFGVRAAGDRDERRLRAALFTRAFQEMERVGFAMTKTYNHHLRPQGLQLRQRVLRVVGDFERVTLTHELVDELLSRIRVVVHDEHVGLLGFHGFGAACRIAMNASMKPPRPASYVWASSVEPKSPHQGTDLGSARGLLSSATLTRDHLLATAADHCELPRAWLVLGDLIKSETGPVGRLSVLPCTP
jgi:hypothetical protein